MPRSIRARLSPAGNEGKSHGERSISLYGSGLQAGFAEVLTGRFNPVREILAGIPVMAAALAGNPAWDLLVKVRCGALARAARHCFLAPM